MTTLRTIDALEARQGIIDFWNAQLGQDFPLDEALLRQNLGLERDEHVCFVAEEGGGIAGLAIAKRARRKNLSPAAASRGYLSLLLVDAALRRQGIGSALLKAAETWLRDREATHLRVGGDHYHFFPGLPLEGGTTRAAEAFLDAKGFDRGEVEHDLIGDLDTLGFDELQSLLKSGAPADRSSPDEPPSWGGGAERGIVREDGLEFRHYRPGLRRATGDFFARCFPGRWESDVLEAIEAGLDPADLLLITRKAPTGGGSGKGDEVLGFCRVGDDRSLIRGPGLYWKSLLGDRPGALGPIGIDPLLRGRNLGLGLLAYGISELKTRGARMVVIDWTDLVGFYGKLGFAPWKSYRMYGKTLGA
ncbi:MAG TPA: GNAT family N-acetyltransferase [Rectinemataceae bacterium]|nr:GNAT family N-acetyltransferase [Rectinemataceae bacterium]